MSCADVGDALRMRSTAIPAGVDARALLADPGIGFAKTVEHNLALLKALPEIASRAGVPILVGTSA